MNATEKNLQLTVPLELQDYWRFNRGILWHRFKWFLILPLILLGYVLFYGISQGFTLGLLWGLWPVGLIAFVMFSTYLGAKREFAKNEGLREPAQYTFSDVEVYRKAVSSDSTVGWHLFHEARETSQDFFLFLSPNQAFMLPKRCFDSELQISVLRELLQARLGNKAKMK